MRERGHDVGPNLTGQSHRSVEDLISNILDPNMAMNPAFATVSVELKDGDAITFLPRAGVALRMPFDEIADPKNDVYTLEYIAEKIGYSSMSTFHKAFKSITGITPFFYKKSLSELKSEKETS